jgi:hypothetical protein
MARDVRSRAGAEELSTDVLYGFLSAVKERISVTP